MLTRIARHDGGKTGRTEINQQRECRIECRVGANLELDCGDLRGVEKSYSQDLDEPVVAIDAIADHPGANTILALFLTQKKWSERRDLNPRPPDPQSDALPGCATLRHRRDMARRSFISG